VTADADRRAKFRAAQAVETASRLRVLHLPTPVGGHYWGLAQGERKLGLDSSTLVTQDSWVKYPADINLKIDTLMRVGKMARLVGAFLKHRNRHDVFHFNFGTSLLDFPQYGFPLLDLPWYPKGKKIVMTYNGCDARQKHKTMARVPFSPCHEDCCNGGICNSGKADRIKARKIEKVARYADHIFAVNPDLMWFLPPGKSSFLPYAIAEWDNIRSLPYSPGETLTIVHAPTNRAAKGTEQILQAISRLKARHREIEVRLVENIPNKDALEVYRSADLVVDQVLAGWYGGLAVEVMKMGKPVAVYIREEDLRFIPPAMAADLKDAVIHVTPHDMESVLEGYLQDRELLKRKSEAGREYVARWHDPLYVAGITKAVYES
jgi:hypothetical protein